MRWIVAVLALGLAACDASINTDKGGAAPAGGYTLEIRATRAQQTYLVTTPDGRTVGARAADGASALMTNDRAQALAANPPPRSTEDGQQVMSLRVPGFEMSVAGSDEDANGDRGNVQMSIGGRQNITINADEGGPGDADDRAHVRITGADEDAVRKFIADADELSPEVRTQMLAELQLN